MDQLTAYEKLLKNKDDEKKGIRQCPKCSKYRKLEFFSKRSNREGYRAHCNPCQTIAYKTYRKNNLEKTRLTNSFSHAKRKYGISRAIQEKMLLEQNHTCKICNLPERVRRQCLSIDHNHITGKVRGYLCSTCNSGLGQFYDNIDLLKSAIKYLEETDG